MLDIAPVRWNDWAEDPYPLYRLLRDDSPVFYDEPTGMHVLTRYEDVDRVLKDPRRFSNFPQYMVDRGYGDPVSPMREQDPPRHTFLRRIVMPMFTPGEMRRLTPGFRVLARELLDAAEQTEVIEVSSALAIPLPGRVTCDLLGLPVEAHARFMRLTEERQAFAASNTGRTDHIAGLRPIEDIRAEQWAIVEPILQARRAQPEHDALSLLAGAQAEFGESELSDEQIVDMLLHLLTGGFHTTQHLVETLFDLIADRPDLWRALDEDRRLIPLAIEEMLRFDAPVQALRRRALEDVSMHDREIPAGSTFAVVFGSGNRDERVFEDPDTFRLDRGGNRHLAFSAGIHYCPGAPVSRFEVRELIDEMLDRYETIERAGPSVRDAPSPHRRTVELMRGFTSVPVSVVRKGGQR